MAMEILHIIPLFILYYSFFTVILNIIFFLIMFFPQYFSSSGKYIFYIDFSFYFISLVFNNIKGSAFTLLDSI